MGLVVALDFNWTCDVSGNVEKTIASPLLGQVLDFKTKPGTPAPTALYDVTIEDENGIDVLNAKGADRSATLGETVKIDHAVNSASFVFKVANAGISKQGFAQLLIRWG